MMLFAKNFAWNLKKLDYGKIGRDIRSVLLSFFGFVNDIMAKVSLQILQLTENGNDYANGRNAHDF